MSGNSKKVLYNILSFILWLAAIAGEILLMLFTVPMPIGTSVWLVGIAFILSIALRIPAAVHELGHLLFGWLCGMKFVGTTISYFRIAKGKVRFCHSESAGSTEMHPKNGKHIRGKAIVFTAGGFIFCFAAGGILLTLYLVFPFNPGLLFGGFLSVFLFYEGLLALYPAELPAGKTDGAVLFGILNGSDEENIMLRVLTAQGILYRGTYRDIDRGLLFSVPVVREDLPAYHALLMLQIEYLKDMGEREEAEKKLGRLRSLREYLTDEEKMILDKFEL